MKLKKKFLLGILAVSMSCIILQPNRANAALQSNGGEPATKLVNDWILQIRQMQELGGTLGRTDTVNTTDLTSNVTDLDIHMEKNTEYGAMAILSASAYGNPNPIGDGETTTGNSTGIVMNINSEWVAAGYTEVSESNFLNASSRYKNIYELPIITKIGDATEETSGWHSSNVATWMTDSSRGLLRSYSGSSSIFSFFGGNDNYYPWASSTVLSREVHSSRACIVVGTGI